MWAAFNRITPRDPCTSMPKRGKADNQKPLRPGLFHLKGSLNFVENALGQV